MWRQGWESVRTKKFVLSGAQAFWSLPYPLLPFHVPSCDLAQWWNSGSQKNSLTLRGHTTKWSQTQRCQTSLLCNFEAQDTAFSECFNNKRSACTPPTSADLAPQMYFPEGGEWAQQRLRKPIFKENAMHTSFYLDTPTSLRTNTALTWNETQKPDAGK